MKVLLIPSYNLVLVQNVITSQSYVESQDASLYASDIKLLIPAHSLLLWPPSLLTTAPISFPSPSSPTITCLLFPKRLFPLFIIWIQKGKSEM